MDSRVVYRIDLAQLKKNISFIQSCAGDCKLMPILKYDAYGMGALEVGSALKEAGAFRFGAANCEEALQLKRLGLDVQILGVLFPWEIAPAAAANIICPVCSAAIAKEISREAVKQGRKVRIAIKLDTGMGRLGLQPAGAVDEIAEICRLPNLQPDSLFSHFASAAQPDRSFSGLQIERFLSAKSALDARGIFFPFYHHAAGDAAVKLPQAVSAPFNLIRPGGMMYGDDFTGGCRQIVELTTFVGDIRELPAGASVGYYRTYIAGKKIRAAILAAGYADGIPLALSNQGRVVIRGQYCPVLGRVSMDYTVVDISDLPEVSIGDEAVLLGRRGDNAVSVREWSRIKNTHSHDIWCAIGHRAKREYIR